MYKIIVQLLSWTPNNKINRVHMRILTNVYSDYKSSFKDLPNKDGSFASLQKNFKAWPFKFINIAMAYLQQY